MRYIVGIDEAGRGPLAGPVAIGAVRVREGFERRFFKGIKDSKKLSEEDRELWFQLALEARRRGDLDFAVSLVSESVIDQQGINEAICIGINRVLRRVCADPGDKVFLDGGIKAPKKFEHQKTVVKGDEKIPVISLASILAKVVRDRRMTKVSKRYPEFDFHVHKGYGTLAHREAIKKYGPKDIHRKSFLSNIDMK